MVYCGRLSLVADLLQGLFKEAYSLQKGLLELLDKISFDSSASEEEVSDIVTGVFIACTCTGFIFLNEILCSFNAFFIFLSDSYSAGYLLCHLQPGHSIACKHMEVPREVSTLTVMPLRIAVF